MSGKYSTGLPSTANSEDSRTSSLANADLAPALADRLTEDWIRAAGEALTLRALFERHSQEHGLHWVLGEQSADEPLDLGELERFPTALVGHLNLIRPNRIQVLGSAEIDYLQGLSSTARRAVFEQLFSHRPCALIVADNAQAPVFLVDHCRSQQTPLLSAEAASHAIVGSLLVFLARLRGRSTNTHGVFIEVLGVGLLLTGQAGVGKSELALELITRGHRLIADDAPLFRRVDRETIEGSCPAPLIDFMEVRGIGLINVRRLFGDAAVKPRRNLRLVICLENTPDDAYSPDERLYGVRRSRNILGVDIPEVALPVAPGHNLPVLVETTVRNYILRMSGYDATEEFAKRHKTLLKNQREAARGQLPASKSIDNTTTIATHDEGLGVSGCNDATHLD